MPAFHRFQGTWRYLQDRWPAFLAGFGGTIALALLAIVVSSRRGWFAFSLFAAAALLVAVYFLLANLWAIHKEQDEPDFLWLFEQAQIAPTDTVVLIELGAGDAGTLLHRRFTSGKLILFDLYNPQLTPDRALERARQRRSPLPLDPRLSPRSGQVELLSLPDNSVPAVFLSHVLACFWQEGDRERLLQEVHRILAPGGRLLFAERVRTLTNWLILGPAAVRLHPPLYWDSLLQEAGFKLRQSRLRFDLSLCCQAQKPTPEEARQLVFDF